MARPHASAVVEDAWNSQRERVLRKRGWGTRVISHTGYGSTDFVRVFARVVLGRALGDDDEDGAALVEPAAQGPNPVTQDEVDAGSIELF